jgi:hypothetical protein
MGEATRRRWLLLPGESATAAFGDSSTADTFHHISRLAAGDRHALLAEFPLPRSSPVPIESSPVPFLFGGDKWRKTPFKAINATLTEALADCNDPTPLWLADAAVATLRLHLLDAVQQVGATRKAAGQPRRRAPRGDRDEIAEYNENVARELGLGVDEDCGDSPAAGPDAYGVVVCYGATKRLLNEDQFSKPSEMM